MNQTKQIFCLATALLSTSLGILLAQEFRITDVNVTSTGQATIQYQSVRDARFALLKGGSVMTIQTSVATNVGVAGLDKFLYTVEPGESAAFFIVQRLANEPPAVGFTVNARPFIQLLAAETSDTFRFAAPVDFALAAAASDSDGSIASVEFSANGKSLALLTEPPYQFVWTNVPIGSYSIIAKATDNLGFTGTSATLDVVIAANTPPGAVLTAPREGEVLLSSSDILLSANATDADGKILKVEFLDGAERIGEVIAPPFSFIWKGAAPGSHSISARATDNVGATTTSAAATINVKLPQTLTKDATIDASESAYDKADLVLDSATVTLSGCVTLNSLTLKNGAVLTHVAGDTNGLCIHVLGDATIDLSSRIDVSGRGYDVADGPGKADNRSSRGGAGYGGRGSSGSEGAGGAVYGSITAPVDLGSGAGSAGGGAVRLVVGGKLTVDGQILANGMGGNFGAGSGGSIYLTVSTLAGRGAIAVNGGNAGGGANGGGGGGRVAAFYENTTFTGQYFVSGGSGLSQDGGAGTIYTKGASEPLARLTVASSNNTAGNAAETLLFETASLTTNLSLTVSGATLSVQGLRAFDSVTVINKGIVTHPATLLGGLRLEIASDATIDLSSRIDVSGRGYDVADGPGKADNRSQGGGAGYGGRGGNGVEGTGGGVYGSITAPMDLGSGAGSAGGGAVRLVVGGKLTVDGQVLANGLPGQAGSGLGAGSGGSIFLTVSTLAGRGAIAANGNDGGGNAGGSGGGRIAVLFENNTFTGQYFVSGGSGLSQYGGAGTIYTKGASEPLARLTVASSNNTAGNAAETLLFETASLTTNLSLTVSGATLSVQGLRAFDSVTVINKGIVTHPATLLGGLRLEIASDATIDLSSRIDVSGRGYDVADGPGKADNRSQGGGAGYGGRGGNGVEGTGGGVYGSITAPMDLGSGAGSAGGGAVRLVVGGKLTVDGQVLANGLPAQAGSGLGAGSGGSIFLTVSTLAGRGAIAANGNDGGGNAGGSGGGRIAVLFENNTFTGQYFVSGGIGWFQDGGAGTIYTKGASEPLARLTVASSNSTAGSAAETPLLETASLTTNLSLTVSGATLSIESLRAFDSVAVINKGIVTHPATLLRGLRLEIANDATIDLSSRIDVSGRGYDVADGPGKADNRNQGGGAGYGGRGGNGQEGAGGAVYGSITAPVDLGSGAGSAGGGAVRLVVGGMLTVDGQILANGLVEAGGAGGPGSGGSIYLTVSTLAGRGAIAANGGYGGGVSGGGGGGRVAVCYRDNTFTGLFFVAGGSGWKNGGVGSLNLSAGCMPGEPSVPVTVKIDPARTYLLTSEDPAQPAPPIDLSALGITPGDQVRLERLGSFLFMDTIATPAFGMAGVFSGSPTLLAFENLNRVQDAIETGVDHLTPNTLRGGLSTDIPDDFAISDVTVTVPPDAKYLFISSEDVFYSDNLDPDGDFALRITRLAP